MFETVSPESVGIHSQNVEQFINYLNSNCLATHSLMLIRGNKIFCEAYWKPFTKRSLHRMYSETKSFVGIAICHLISQKKIKLSDRIVDYFEDKLPSQVPVELRSQTIEDMLTMKTCMEGNYWFDEDVTDRIEYYFRCSPKKNPNTQFAYDSDASFVLSVLVERVAGKPFLEYLKEICLDEIGFSNDAKMLSCIGGYPWGDSGMICRTEDICKFARFIADRGAWNGKQLMDPDMIKEATEFHIDTVSEKHPFGQCGYGYQVWKNPKGGFSFFGMHGQYMHYDPKTDIIFACTSGNKTGNAGQVIFDGLDRFIFNTDTTRQLSENSNQYLQLKDMIDNLSLFSLCENSYSSIEKNINGKKFIFSENPMGMFWIIFDFFDDNIQLEFQNKQGIKRIVFGRNENRLQHFPQLGYSREVGGIDSPGNTYKCVASATWQSRNTLITKIQVIDEYIGILDMRFIFKSNGVKVFMEKDAENFLKEYEGVANGYITNVQ